jgi:hypothetical protein
MASRRDRDPKRHAEGGHGPKTHESIMRQLQSRPQEEPTSSMIEQDRHRAAYEGKRRLVEDRMQHDEAEKNSERRQLFEEHARGRDDGPSDNRGALHGVLGSRGNRADNRMRDEHGLRAKED